ncbi:preprotein translocase subunit SecE [Lachnospiraceae bacterium PF1-22]
MVEKLKQEFKGINWVKKKDFFKLLSISVITFTIFVILVWLLNTVGMGITSFL